ncbi:MAG: ATP-binding protein [Paracoccaceae bacterium]
MRAPPPVSDTARERARLRAADRPRWARRLVAVAALAAVAVAIAVLARSLVAKLDDLAGTDSESVTWTLTQQEIEAQKFRVATLAARLSPDPQALAEVRTAFDIYYSRHKTLMIGRNFRTLRETDVTADVVANSWEKAQALLPTIDADDAALRAALPELARAADEQAGLARTIALETIARLAVISDNHRSRLRTTLSYLGLAALVLVLMLTGVATALDRLYRKTRQQAHEVRVASERLETIAQTSLDAIVVLDRNGEIVEFNEAARRIFALQRQQVAGMRFSELTGLDLGELPRSGRIETRVRRPDGEVFAAELSISQADAHATAATVVFLRNIADRAAAEAELLRARDDALAGERAKARFLAVMSHEMRTPLNGLLGMIELLRAEKLGRKLRNYVGVMEASGRILLHHINDVLELSRNEAGEQHVAVTEFDLDLLIDEILGLQLPLAENSGLTLRLEKPAARLGTVSGDPMRLRQILLNLLDNAVKFTPSGEVTLAIARNTDDVRAVDFHVTDTGPGIPAAALDRIFDDFVTLGASAAPTARGTGLGLGIARRLAMALGGTISVESAENRGSQFHLTLPLPPASGDADGRLAPLAGLDTVSNPLELLVVEDNRINRFVLREMLIAMGHTVREAVDGREGVDLARDTLFDLIFMDISMPNLDGVTASRLIRAGGASARAPIVALTAHAFPEELNAFRQARIDTCLTKPVDGKTLRRILAGTVEAAPAISPEPGQDTLAELRDSLGDGATTALVRRFVEEADLELARLGDGSRPPDAEMAVATLHRLAGSAATFGAEGWGNALRAEIARCRSTNAAPQAGDLARLAEAWQAERQRYHFPA